MRIFTESDDRHVIIMPVIANNLLEIFPEKAIIYSSQYKSVSGHGGPTRTPMNFLIYAGCTPRRPNEAKRVLRSAESWNACRLLVRSKLRCSVWSRTLLCFGRLRCQEHLLPVPEPRRR